MASSVSCYPQAAGIEIQGDKREEVKAVLEDAGFKVVFAGG